MGQYYIIYNFTKKQSAKPAFANWKLGEWDWEDVIAKMGWEASDELRAYGDYGDVVSYKDGREEEEEEVSSSEDEKNESENLSVQNFEKKYVCNVTGKILDQPYSWEEYFRLVKK